MNKLFKTTLFALAFITLVACENAWGTCPKFDYALDTFNTEEYLGKWYEIARHKSTPFQKGECTTAEYSINESGNIKVNNTEFVNGKYNSILGEAVKTEDQFRLKVSFGDSFVSKLFKGDYRVVDTDYKSYALVYSCTDFIFGKFYFVWVLAREPVLPEATLQKITGEIHTKLGISKDELRFNNQSTELCGSRSS